MSWCGQRLLWTEMRSLLGFACSRNVRSSASSRVSGVRAMGENPSSPLSIYHIIFA